MRSLEECPVTLCLFKTPWERRYTQKQSQTKKVSNFLVGFFFDENDGVLQVGKAIQLVSTFVGGFVIAFIRGWLLTLVMLCSIPLLVMAGAALAIVISKTASRGQSAYAKAAIVVEQTIGSIRTVIKLAYLLYTLSWPKNGVKRL